MTHTNGVGIATFVDVGMWTNNQFSRYTYMYVHVYYVFGWSRVQAKMEVHVNV